jgi:hypothetical protein
MGLFGYSFIDLSKSQKHARREALDLHALIAQVSVGIVLALIQLYFLLVWISGRFGDSNEEERPSSPYAKHEDSVRRGKALGKAREIRRRVVWWCGDDLGLGLGVKRGEVLIGAIWAIWLGFLCVQGTGEGERSISFNLACILKALIQLNFVWSCHFSGL